MFNVTEQVTISMGEGADNCLASDMANAARFVRQHGKHVRFCHAWSKWLIWDGKRFKPDDAGKIIQRGKKTVNEIWAEIPALSRDKQNELITWAKRSQSAERIAGMLKLAQSDVPVSVGELDADPMLLNVANGVIDLRTAELLPHDPARMITKLAPVKFDPAATCPTWTPFIDDITLQRPGLIRFLQEYAGYSCTGKISEQCFGVFHGIGHNGKTTLVETLRAMLGDYATRADFSTFLAKQFESGPRNDIASLAGARMVTASEADEGKRFNEALLKDITGGETIAARFLYSEKFEFRPQFKLWLLANHKPIIRGTDVGIWRRVRLVPFDFHVTDENKDKHLDEKLLAELPGILNWCLDGCVLWQQGELSMPDEVKAATEAYRTESDTLGQFMDECCIVAANATAGATALYQTYHKWAEQSGMTPMSQTALGRRLNERGFIPDRDSATGRKTWRGIGILARVGADFLNSSE